MKETEYSNIGNGKPDCPECSGRGVITLEENHAGISKVRSCKCVLIKDVLLNVERGWRGLSKSPSIKKSPLLKYRNKNVWITATLKDFKKHLKHVAIRQGPRWNFRVQSDRDLVVARLAVAKATGRKIIDSDVENSTIKYMTLEDLVDPPELLILVLGVKTSRNSEMPEILLDSLQSRDFSGKPTWVIDQPHNPLRLGHRCFSEELISYLETWDHKSFGKSKASNNPFYQKNKSHLSKRKNQTSIPEEDKDFLFGKTKKKKKWK